jgi:hypothetical protein
MHRRTIIATVTAIIGLLATGAGATAAVDAARSHSHHDGLGIVRAATARFHNIATAEQRGYALLTDAQGIACIDMPGMGAMGVHWANTTLVGDAKIHAAKPEAVVYAPTGDGTLRLAAAEYVVLKADWDANHSRPPALFGHEFDLTPAPNRYGLPAFYSLHAWAWKHNPAGRFAMWNPAVRCPPGKASHGAHATAG